MTTEREPLVVPFVGEHFAALDRLGDLLAPPYDVIGETERAAFARAEHNIVHLILPAGGEERYRTAASTLDLWRRERVLVTDPTPAAYVVQQEFPAPGGEPLVRTGVIGAVAAEPFTAGRVRPHERTHAGPKQDRLSLMRSTRTMFESLLMLARDADGRLVELLAAVTSGAPWTTGRLGDTTIRMWRVDGPAASRLTEAAGRDMLYIADGHHRFETAVAFREELRAAARTLALIVPLGDPGLVVLPTHRIVYGRDLAEDVADRLPGLAGTGGASRLSPGTCAVVLPGKRERAISRANAPECAALQTHDPPVRRLDVTWADACIVAVLREAAAESRVGYSSQTHEVREAVQSGHALAGVLLAAPAVADVLDVADAGAFMPQKSTYFMPKVPSGLVLLPYGSA